MMRKQSFLPLFYRLPSAWAAMGLAAVMMFINVLIPSCFRVLMDVVIPLRSGEGFVLVLGTALVSLTVFSMARSAMRYFQSTARDEAERILLAMKMQQQFQAFARGDATRVAALQALPKDVIYRAAELLGNEPAQLVSGLVYLTGLLVALGIVAGPMISLIILFVFATQLYDLYLGGREGFYQQRRARAVGDFLRRENHMGRAVPAMSRMRLDDVIRRDVNQALDDWEQRKAELRRVQFFHDIFRNASFEWLYAAAFAIAGYQAFLDRITYGEFVFIITMLLQVQIPVSVIIQAIVSYRRHKPVLQDMAILLGAEQSTESSSHPSAHLPAPSLPCRVIVRGKSGVGKTTLALAWAKAWERHAEAQVILVPQDLSLYPMDVGHILREVEARMPGLIELFALRDLMSAQWTADALSGGERRRLMIAHALSLKPQILVLDEPEAGLDEVNRQSVLLALQSAVDASASMSVVVITHDRGFALAGAKTIDLAQSVEHETIVSRWQEVTV